MRNRIILADDHVELLDLLKRILEADFDVVATAQNGLELVEQVRRLEPDVAVTDIAMPLLNGLDAIRQLQDGRTRTRFVVHTASSDALLASDALRLGALGYVLKHSSCSDLLSALRAALDGEVFISSSVVDELREILLRPAS